MVWLRCRSTSMLLHSSLSANGYFFLIIVSVSSLRGSSSLQKYPNEVHPFLTVKQFRIPMGRLATLYLFTYNSVQAGGWTVALIKLLTNVSSTKSIDGTYDAAGQLICLLQLFSVMEVFHGAIGIVPTKVLPVLMQWGGRTHFVAAIVCQIPEVQKLPTVFVTFAAWSLSEVIRYPQYALNAVGHCPGWLTWLRYSAFVVLYPIGAIFGEVLTMYHALSYIKKKHLYGNLFDKLPFSYYSFVMALLACYPFFVDDAIHVHVQTKKIQVRKKR